MALAGPSFSMSKLRSKLVTPSAASEYVSTSHVVIWLYRPAKGKSILCTSCGSLILRKLEAPSNTLASVGPFNGDWNLGPGVGRSQQTRSRGAEPVLRKRNNDVVRQSGIR